MSTDASGSWFMAAMQSPCMMVSKGRTRRVELAFGAALGMNCALLVDRLAGLRSSDQMTVAPNDGAARPAFAGGVLIDPAQRQWQTIDLAQLAQDEHFLSIVAA